MVGEEDNDSPPPPPLPLSLPLPPSPAAAGGDNGKTYSRSVSWAGNSPVKSNPSNPKSLWHGKARACLPPLSVPRPKAEEWPRAGSDDLGVWPDVATTPGARHRPPPLHLNSDEPLFEFKRDKLAYFDKECSRIIDHVFLGSDAVAKNRDVLRQNGITHVLNCVGFVCPEYFKHDLVYKTLWLRDSPSEDITSILYDVFDYFEDVRERKGRVLVHCCQGVSRSTSLVIAYLMWLEGQSFDDALQQVKASRGVTNPNMGFACQLLQCQKRVHAVPVSPNSVLRMFRMAPHSSYAPLHLVPKLLTQPNAKALDSRGAFIVHVPNNLYVWIGKNCVPLMSESASLAASQVIRYEKANGPALSITEGEEPVEFWCALTSEKEETEDRGVFGVRRVVDYDLDFEIFDKAANGGVVPPLAISDNGSETCLPARQSGWERLRRKFAYGVMKELIMMDHSCKEFECTESPDSFASFPASPSWVKDTTSKGDQDDNSECHSPDSFSSFLVKDSRKFVNSSPSLSPSTSEYSSSFTFSPTSSNWSDSSYGLGTSNHDPPRMMFEERDQISETPKNLLKSWSFLEDQSMKDAEDGIENDDDYYDTCEAITDMADFVLYQWPTMEKVETGCLGILDSRSVYIVYAANLILDTDTPDVLYIWVGRDVSCISDGGDGGIEGDIRWQTVGHDFLVRKGLATSSLVQIVREGQEPEQPWNHLNCLSFQKSAEKGDG